MNLLPRFSDDHLLHYLTPHERKYVIDNTTALDLLPDEVLITRGDVDDTMYLVERGKLDVIDDRGEEEIVIAVLGPGDVLGEMAFLDSLPRSATVRVRAAATVRAFDRGNLQFIAREAPEILGKLSLALCEIFCERLRGTLEQLSAEVQMRHLLLSEWSMAGNSANTFDLDEDDALAP